MPVIIRGVPPTPKRGPRGRHYDSAVRRGHHESASVLA
jgi:hypothetical protein